MSGTRKKRSDGVGVADTRLTVPLPKEIDRQLRAYAAHRSRPLAPIVREWIIEKLALIDTTEQSVSWIVNPAYSSDPVMLTKAGLALMMTDLPADFMVRRQ